MILDFIVTTYISFVKLVFGALPSVPATPQAIIDGGQWILDTIGGVVSVISMVLSPALMAACVVIIIAVFNFEMIYHGIMWIIRKIPMINMK